MTAGNSNLSLMTWNVKGLNNPVKRKKVLNYIKSKNIDIVFM